MLQEDSNGEASFEIIDKKADDSTNNGDKTESLSSVSSAYSIPSPSVLPLPGGNLLSNLQPPTKPDFTLWQSQCVPAPSALPPNILPPTQEANLPVTTNVQPFPQTQFSAAIPPSKGVQHGPVPLTAVDSTQGAGGLIGWMKDAVSSGGILSKVAEKAKNSVDSLITTLDPQMSEFIYSGGNFEFAVASQDQHEIAPIRDAVFSVFGKAWVNGIKVETQKKKLSAVGFDEGVRRAEEKLEAALQTQKIPTIAVEDFLLKQHEQWFDLKVLLLKDAEKQITVHTFTQTTPIPLESLLKHSEKISTDSDSVEKLLTAYLTTEKTNLDQVACGVSQKEILFMAAKALLTSYKEKLSIN